MTATGYMALGYALACSLLWGYALSLWAMYRKLQREAHRKGVER